MRICVVTPSEIEATETFIRAHIKRLAGDIKHLSGYWLDYTWQNRKLMELYQESHHESGQWLNLLPRFIEFRLRRKFFPRVTDFDVACDFLKSQKVDVVLAEYGTAAAFITPVCKAIDIPLVAHFHGADASRYKTLRDFKDRYQEMFNYASSVISVSHAMSRKLMDLGCSNEKICYNPYGPDQQFFEVTPDYKSDTLLAVGRQTGKKGPYLTLDAFRRALKANPELKLCMIGQGDLLEVSMNLAKAWGIEDSVEFVGSASPDEIRARMHAACAFVQHSLVALDGDSEGTPVAIIEAAAAGLPVISTRHAGIPDVVIDGITGFIVEPCDSRAMADRIVRLSCDQTLAEQLGQEARHRISTHFSMDKHISNLDQLLQKAKDNCAPLYSTNNFE